MILFGIKVIMEDCTFSKNLLHSINALLEFAENTLEFM